MLSAYKKIEIINTVLMLGLSCKVKLKGETAFERWSDYLGLPVETYFEPSWYGPYPISELDWVLIDPIEQKWIGRLVADQVIDHSSEITELFNGKGLEFEMQDFYFKVSFV